MAFAWTNPGPIDMVNRVGPIDVVNRVETVDQSSPIYSRNDCGEWFSPIDIARMREMCRRGSLVSATH